MTKTPFLNSGDAVEFESDVKIVIIPFFSDLFFYHDDHVHACNAHELWVDAS